MRIRPSPSSIAASPRRARGLADRGSPRSSYADDLAHALVRRRRAGSWAHSLPLPPGRNARYVSRSVRRTAGSAPRVECWHAALVGPLGIVPLATPRNAPPGRGSPLAVAGLVGPIRPSNGKLATPRFLTLRRSGCASRDRRPAWVVVQRLSRARCPAANMPARARSGRPTAQAAALRRRRRGLGCAPGPPGSIGRARACSRGTPRLDQREIHGPAGRRCVLRRRPRRARAPRRRSPRASSVPA